MTPCVPLRDARPLGAPGKSRNAADAAAGIALARHPAPGSAVKARLAVVSTGRHLVGEAAERAPPLPFTPVTLRTVCGNSVGMINVTHDGPIATVALDRPAARNALPLDAWPELAQAMASLPHPTRAVLLTSANDGAFSAGADIGEFAALRGDTGARVAFRTAMRDAIEAIAAAQVPTIAAIDGACFGAAVALALACDIRVAGDGASFATTPAKLGIGYPAEDVARLIAQVGRGQASRLLFTAEAISADEAHRIGLAELRAAHAANHAHDFARRIAAHPPAAVRALKRVLADPVDPGHAAAFDAAFGSDDFAHALAAFTSRKTRA